MTQNKVNKEIKATLAAATLAAVAGIGIVSITQKRNTLEDKVIVNPVITWNDPHTYSVSSCQYGYLSGYLQVTNRHQGTEPQKLLVVPDLDERERPRFVVQLNGEKILHLPRYGQIPWYESYGIGGARSYQASGKYPCPAWQWTTDRLP